MNLDQLQATLNTLFQEKRNRILFWYDGEKEFEDTLPSLQLDHVKIVRLDEIGSLKLKIDIELGNPETQYLLYAPIHEPPPEDDWLYDIRLYSQTFHADKASIIFNELNLAHRSICPHLKKRISFFNNKDRLHRVKKWIKPDDREDELDLKMLSVLTRSDQPDLFSILMKLFESCGDGNTFDASMTSKDWQDMEKLGLTIPFWKFVSQTFGYISENPNLNDLLLRLFVTDFANLLKTDLPTSLEHFFIPSDSMNATVFLSQWRSNINYYKIYNRISYFIAKKLKIDDLLIKMQFEDILDVMTFESVERRIISNLRDQITPSIEGTVILEAIKTRLDGYWATITSDEAPINLYKTAYHALENAINLFRLRSQYDAGFSFPTAEIMFHAYIKELFRFDQRYRKFGELSDKIEMGGWDVLKSLRETVEACYSGWYMDQVSLTWGDFLEGDHGLLNKWRIPSVPNQHEFFKRIIYPKLYESQRNRIFVVISDGFRYEAAEELAQIINGKYRLKAELKPMLGVLPSYTALGMAALLPHSQLSFKGKSVTLRVDGKSSNSMDSRMEILSKHHGTAIKAEDLTAMNKEQGREFIKPHRLIYIYHDKVDAVGDKGVSEHHTFEAVREAIESLSALINFIINNLNGTRVFITADHGFVYQDMPPTPMDKSLVNTTDKEVLKNHKRFILGYGFERSGNTFRANMKKTANTDEDVEILMPKGTNRFNFMGGAKYYHGGPLLQEIVIPVLEVSEMKGKHLGTSEIKQVGVSLIGTYKKIVTNIPRFDFIQTDAVSERFKTRSLKISIRDGNELISDEKILTFDSASSSIEDRKKSLTLILKTGQQFDNKREYHLVLRNADDDTEYDRVPMMVDIAFASDF